MADRYFVAVEVQGNQARLTGAEAHHLAHVMRAKAGDEVVLFDGSGAEFLARVEQIDRAEIGLSIESRLDIDREATVPLVLGVALPKGDRQRWLVEKGVELGVGRLVPLVTERGNQPPSPSALERLRRTVVEASKQSGRNRLLEIPGPQSLDEFLAQAAPEGAWRWLAHPGADPLRRVFDESIGTCPRPSEVLLAIGPEGGFAGAEVERAIAAGWRTVGFGPRILRIETAALALVAAVTAHLDAR